MEDIQVHKFGGASIAKAELFRNVSNIVQNHIPPKAVIVVSALGKTTNAMELIVDDVTDSVDYTQHLNTLRTTTQDIVTQLFGEASAVGVDIDDMLVEIDWIADEHNDNYDYVYDQIVSIGELMSSKILYTLLSQNAKVALLDARDCILTDQAFRTANVHWEQTRKRIQANVIRLMEQYDYVITQGFIGSDIENNTTTLGREGSDYTASIFANSIDASSVTAWKDVPGIMSADPKINPDAELITSLSYAELEQMTLAGAKIIHPKTVAPLREKNIPLRVKSFLNPEREGSVIK